MMTHTITKLALATFCMTSTLKLESATTTSVYEKSTSWGSRICKFFVAESDSEAARRKLLYKTLWDVAPTMPKELIRLILEYAARGYRFGAPIRSIALGGNYLAAGGQDGKVMLWNLEAPLKAGLTLDQYKKPVTALSFQKDPCDTSYVLISGATLRGAPLVSIELSPAEKNLSKELELHAVADGEYEMKYQDEAIRMWNPVKATLLANLEINAQKPVPQSKRDLNRQIKQAEADQHMQSTTAGSIPLTRYCRSWVWSSKKHIEDFLKIRLIQRPEGAKKDSRNSFGSLSDGQVCEVTPNGIILIHDTKTQAIHILRGHTGKINALVVHKNMPQYVASASDDGTVKIWDISKKQCVQTIGEHTGPVRCITFLADSWQIASAGDDGMVMTHALNKELLPE